MWILISNCLPSGREDKRYTKITINQRLYIDCYKSCGKGQYNSKQIYHFSLRQSERIHDELSTGKTDKVK